MDYILDGQAHGDPMTSSMANLLLANNFDHNCLRPFIGEDGRSYRTRMVLNENTGVYEPQSYLINTTATLRIREWIQLDLRLLSAFRLRLKAVKDLRSRGLEISIPNGWGKTVHEWQRNTDPGEATASMDAIKRGTRDRPTFDTQGVPLFVLHGDYEFTARQLAVARSEPAANIDSLMDDSEAQRVAEACEQCLLGSGGPGLNYQYASYTAYGYLTHPQRLTRTITAPTAGGWIPDTTNTEILAMRQDLIDNRRFGPYAVYFNTKWAKYLDGDYSAAKGDNTLRQRILANPDIQSVEVLDWLPTTGWTILMVQMDMETIRLVVAMEPTLLQWESEGGLQLNWKYMTIMAPELRCDINNRMGLNHGSAA